MSASALAADIAMLSDGAVNPAGGAESPVRPRVMLAIWRSARLVRWPATSRIVQASQADCVSIWPWESPSRNSYSPRASVPMTRTSSLMTVSS